MKFMPKVSFVIGATASGKTHFIGLYLSEQRQPWKEIIYLQQSEDMQRS